MRTLKQRWAFERLFQNVGSLAGIATRLSQIAGAKSTLGDERDKLEQALGLINEVRRRWRYEPRVKDSHERFKEVEEIRWDTT